jgi:predicted RNA-binding Zn-ribbon protein involved in translation (DUF1610 family)
MEKYCMKCGALLVETTLNKFWCRNCGKILENQENQEVENNEAKYIG